jgi:hypothetical protein
MLFIATRVDRPHSVDMRKEARPAHLAVQGLGARVNLGGAFLGPDHESPVGSMLVFEGESESDILALTADDPFSLAGLFESVSVNLWRQGVGPDLT